MQKAILVESSGRGASLDLEVKELNEHLADGWRFVAASPFGCASSMGGKSEECSAVAALLVIVEKEH